MKDIRQLQNQLNRIKHFRKLISIQKSQEKRLLYSLKLSNASLEFEKKRQPISKKLDELLNELRTNNKIFETFVGDGLSYKNKGILLLGSGKTTTSMHLCYYFGWSLVSDDYTSVFEKQNKFYIINCPHHAYGPLFRNPFERSNIKPLVTGTNDIMLATCKVDSYKLTEKLDYIFYLVPDFPKFQKFKTGIHKVSDSEFLDAFNTWGFDIERTRNLKTLLKKSRDFYVVGRYRSVKERAKAIHIFLKQLRISTR